MDRVREHAAGLQLRVIVEVARRMGSLSFLIAAVVAGFGYGRWLWAAFAVVLAIVIYVLPPRPLTPEGALHHERMPSVYMPDLVGFLLATTFLAMPFIISAQDSWLGGPWALMLFMWLPGLIALAIFWMATRYQCFWVELLPDGLTISMTAGIEHLTFGSITGVQAETKRPPRWLGPLLILFGGWRGAGIALLHADTERHALLIDRGNGTKLRLPADAFPDIDKVLKALAKAGVPLDPQFEQAGGRSAPTAGRQTKRTADDKAGQPSR